MIILKILDFLNLLSYDRKLSITNIALYVLLGKLVLSSNVDWPSIVAVITAFANYSIKRVVNQRVANESEQQDSPGSSTP